MSNIELLKSPPHIDPELFRSSIEYTSRATGFRMDLIEKDYYCSIALACIYSAPSPLIFKGGTCLNKIHVGFYRLSEDLDFSIATPIDATRNERRKAVDPVKAHFASIEKLGAGLHPEGTFAGHNEGRQYTATLSYKSIVTGKTGTIKFEVGLREPIFDDILQAPARTLALDPFKRTEILPPIFISCLSAKEAFAEKIRAALTRKDPAIRDLFDLDHAITNQKIDVKDSALVDFVKKKLTIPGTGDIDLSNPRIESMRSQIVTELQPVLRQKDFGTFNFDRSVKILIELENALR